jgi:anti-sigma-K factor RskA
VRLRDDSVRRALAAEFVLGTMSTRVRNRFRSLMRYDAGLRVLVDEWQQSLDPLSAGLAERQPPARVWTSIAARIRAERSRTGSNPSFGLRFWRSLALALTVVLAVGLVYLGSELRGERRPDMMAVLNDAKSEAALLVSWPIAQGEQKFVKVRIVAPRFDPPEGSWELWLIPSDRMDRPISAGVIAMTPDQTLEVSAPAGEALAKAWGFAVSVEPKGGSPTGAPTGPVIFRGPCIRLLNI